MLLLVSSLTLALKQQGQPGDLEAGKVELRLVEVLVLEVEPGEVLQALLEAGDAVLHQVSYQLKRSLRFNPPSEL